MIFRPLHIDDFEIFNRYNPKNLFKNTYGSEFCFASLYAWKEQEKLEIYINNKYLIIKGKYLGKDYFLPVFSNTIENFRLGLKDLSRYCFEHNIYLIIFELDSSFINYCIFNNYDFLFYENSDLAEYIYNCNDLIDLKGKKYHPKRNHLSKFMKNYSFDLKYYQDDLYETVINSIIKWSNIDFNNPEIIAIKNILENYKKLNCIISLLYVNNNFIAFTAFTIINDVAYVLFEKADLNYYGSFQAINYLNAKTHFNNIFYCNRQEDMGITNLKKAKLSYYPEIISKKYTLIPKELLKNIRSLYEDVFEDTYLFNNYVFNNLNFHDIEYINVGKEIVSMLLLQRKTFTFYDKTIDASLITGLCTKKEYRKNGYSKKLICKSLNNLLKKEITIAFLFPFPVSYDYYYNFGFGMMNYHYDKSSNTHKPAQISSLIDFYNKFTLSSSIYLNRNENDFKTLNEKYQSLNAQIQENELGYQVLIENDVEEAIFLNQTPSKKGIMCRILDIKTILQSIKYKNINNTFKIKITDNIIESNNCVLALTLKNGIASIKETDTYDYQFTIEEITEAIFINKNSILDIFLEINVINNDKY